MSSSSGCLPQWLPTFGTQPGVGGGSPLALAVFDDGNGPALYAGGFFNTAGGVPASDIAKWDGNSWSALGSGVSGGVRSLAVSGSSLYVGGQFTTAGGVSANRIALRRGMRQYAGPKWVENPAYSRRSRSTRPRTARIESVQFHHHPGRVASGVTSRRATPVPPVVKIAASWPMRTTACATS